jgi:hypothetical protein
MSKRKSIAGAISAVLAIGALVVSGPLTGHVHAIGGADVVAVEPGGDGH